MVHQKPEGGTSDPELLGWMDGPSWLQVVKYIEATTLSDRDFASERRAHGVRLFTVSRSLFMRERPFAQRPDVRHARVFLTPTLERPKLCALLSPLTLNQ